MTLNCPPPPPPKQRYQTERAFTFEQTGRQHKQHGPAHSVLTGLKKRKHKTTRTPPPKTTPHFLKSCSCKSLEADTQRNQPGVTLTGELLGRTLLWAVFLCGGSEEAELVSSTMINQQTDSSNMYMCMSIFECVLFAGSTTIWRLGSPKFQNNRLAHDFIVSHTKRSGSTRRQ